MAIQVECPNGHRLSCPEDRAGKTGKCPKCGESFTVPESNGKPEDADGAAGEDEDDSESPEADDDTIVFLCPNGHKLNGPSTLQGQPGQCPHCEAKFRIPVYDDEEFEDDQEFEELSLDAGSDVPIDELEEIEEIEEIDEPILPPPPMGAVVDDLFPLGDDGDSHPMARLFATLWTEREHGGIVEIHLENRESIVPDWWARGLSRGNCGVFALQTADGTYSIETVSWDSVKRISVRRIAELPDGVFE
jgi:hypothetical protein